MTPPSGTEPAGTSPPLSLWPLTAAGARQIEHWFDHPEVRHRLGAAFGSTESCA